ncbi:hypothetical protein J7L65_05260 [Candidatus Bathyarchaeota archaeon]|nr:hypothetical protein [Candidatus Bathyarchaeota archaeon]
MSLSALDPRVGRWRSRLVFILGLTMYLLGVYASLLGGALIIIPVILILSVIIFTSYFIYTRMTWRRIVVDEGLTLLTEDLLKILQRHKETERRSRELLKETIKTLEYTPLRLLLYTILLDTEKHERLLETIIEELTREQSIPTLEAYSAEISKSREALRRHVTLEDEMMRMTASEVRKSRSRVIRTLLELILEDERRHHETFSLLLSQK